jgi:hypothetical protein
VLYLLVPTYCPDPTAADMLKMNVLLAAISAANVLLAAAYFPAHPPHCPSASASVGKAREAGISVASLWASWAAMSRNRAFVVICAVYAVIVGVSNCTSSLLTANLAAVGADQATAGWVGFAANLGALVVGVLLGVVTDRLKSRRGALKYALVATVASSGLGYAAYWLLLSGLGPAAAGGGQGLLLTALAYCAATALLGAAIPVMFDLAAELTFPQPEGAMLMYLTGAMNFVGILVLAAPASSFFLWANPATACVGIAGAALLAIFTPNSAPRFEFDEDAKRAGAGGRSARASVTGFNGDDVAELGDDPAEDDEVAGLI